MNNKIVYFIDLPVNNKPRYICDITEKLYTQELTCTIFCKKDQSTQLLDKLLWTWKQESFIPHTLYSGDSNKPIEEPVIISTILPIPHQSNALLLFDPTDDISLFDTYTTIIDFAETYDSHKLKESRIRFKNLRELDKYKLEFLKLSTFLKNEQV